MGQWFGLILCLLALAVITVVCDTFSECENVPNKSFVSSAKGCDYYIYCDDNESFEGSCPTNLMFNIADGSCDDPNNFECTIIGEVSTAPVQTTTSSVTQSTTTSTTVFTSSPPIAPITTTTTTTTTASVTTTTTPPTTDSGGQVVCPQPSRPEEIIYLPNPNSCSEYYMCYRLTPIPMTCPNDLEFNSLTGSCDWPQVANCRIIGTTTTSPRELCTGQMSGYFTYPNSCHYYYRCTSGMLTIQECPIGFGWDPTRKMCTTTGCSS